MTLMDSYRNTEIVAMEKLLDEPDFGHLWKVTYRTGDTGELFGDAIRVIA